MAKRILPEYKAENRKCYVCRLVLRVLMALSALVWIAYIGGAFSAFFTGFTFIFSTSYGWEAVSGVFVLYGIVLWPLFLITAVILIGGAVYLAKIRRFCDREDEKRFLIRFGMRLWKPMVITVVAVAVLYCTGYFFTGTYTGARLLTSIGMERLVSNNEPLTDFIDPEELWVVERNDECAAFPKEMDDLGFLDDLYYVEMEDFSEDGLRRELSGADRYRFIDRDGIYMGVCWVKEDRVLFSYNDEDLDDLTFAWSLQLLKRR